MCRFIKINNTKNQKQAKTTSQHPTAVKKHTNISCTLTKKSFQYNTMLETHDPAQYTQYKIYLKVNLYLLIILYYFFTDRERERHRERQREREKEHRSQLLDILVLVNPESRIRMKRNSPNHKSKSESPSMTHTIIYV